MARTETGATLTQEHRARQLALRAETLREFRTLFPTWQPSDPRSFDRLVAATVPLVDLRRGTSAGIAADYYTAFRVAEGQGGSATPRLAEDVPRGQLATSLEVTGKTQVARSVAAGFSPQAAVQTAQVTMAGAVARHVLGGGRDTIIRSSESDSGAKGWMRVTAADACAFCAMLASRGPVYESSSTAVAGARFSDRVMDFRAHDHCGCSAEPFYEGSQMPAASKRFAELWDEAQREGGSSGTSNDALNNFRRLYDKTQLDTAA